MTEIHVGERVKNKMGAIGVIVSFDDRFICVDFGGRAARLQTDAFERGFLKYERADLQAAIDEALQARRNEEERKAEEERLADERERDACKKMEAEAPLGTKFNCVRLRLEPAPAYFSSIKSRHRALVQGVFEECDKDIMLKPSGLSLITEQSLISSPLV